MSSYFEKRLLDYKNERVNFKSISSNSISSIYKVFIDNDYAFKCECVPGWIKVFDIQNSSFDNNKYWIDMFDDFIDLIYLYIEKKGE